MGDAVWGVWDFHILQMKDGVYDLVFLCDSGLHGITLSRLSLIAPDLANQVPFWELHCQMVSGDNRLKGI